MDITLGSLLTRLHFLNLIVFLPRARLKDLDKQNLLLSVLDPIILSSLRFRPCTKSDCLESCWGSSLLLALVKTDRSQNLTPGTNSSPSECNFADCQFATLVRRVNYLHFSRRPGQAWYPSLPPSSSSIHSSVKQFFVDLGNLQAVARAAEPGRHLAQANEFLISRSRVEATPSRAPGQSLPSGF